MISDTLQNLRIVDLSWVVAGPFCTKLLGMMGAEVIKIETSTRPQFKKREPWLQVLNNSKKSCTINLSTIEGKRLVKQLVSISDIVIENFSTGVMERLDLGYDELCRVKEDIIYVSSSGLGRTGPGKDCLAYGSLLQGFSGWTSLFSQPNPKMEAMGVIPAWIDPITALWEVFTIMAALQYRSHTGKGIYVDLSMLESVIALMPEHIIDFIFHGKNPIPGVSLCDTHAVPHGFYPCKEDDTWIAISARSQSEWRALCDVMENPEWCREIGTDHVEERVRNRKLIDEHLSKYTTLFPMMELFEKLQARGVPVGPFFNFHQLVENPHMQSRGLFVQLANGKGGTELTTTALPWKDEDHQDWKGHLFRPPNLGEHNEYVFLELLQMPKEEFEMYKSKGIIE